MRILLLLLCLYSCASIALCQVSDDAGHHLQLTQPAHRIITLAPDLTEDLFAIGAGKSIIATVDSSDYPPSARRMTRIGSYAGLDLERIITLHPDLIVTWGANFARELAILKQMKIPVYVASPKQLQDIPRTMINLGCLTGKQARARQAAAYFSAHLRQLQKRYEGQKKVTVFYQIGAYSLFTINHESWINQVINLCGGYNIFASLATSAPEVSWEAVISANPQVIISDAKSGWQRRWAKWPEVAAVNKHHLYTIDPNIIDRAGPRLLQGAGQICQDLAVARAGLIAR